MLKENEFDRNVPRAEYDDRAREAHLRLAHLERRLVNHRAVRAFGLFRIFRLLGASVAGGRKEADTTGSLNDQRPCDIPMAVALSVA